MQDLAKVIETAFELGEKLSPVNVEQEVLEAIVESINLLDQGKIRVAAPTPYGWKVNEWVKKAVLLSFKFSENQTIPGSHTNYFDKVQFQKYEYARIQKNWGSSCATGRG